LRIARWYFAAVVVWMTGCASVDAPPLTAAGWPASVRELRYLSAMVVPRATQGVTKDFGGISGIDRNPATQIWYMLSDDKSEIAPARFYTATIDIDEWGFRSIRIVSAVTLKQADGTAFPSSAEFSKIAAGEVPDPEALRVDPVNGDLVWASEGDRRLGLPPFIKRSAYDGTLLSEIPLPSNLKVEKQRDTGPRHNLNLEGLAFTPDGRTLWVSMETALSQDGPVSGATSGSLARFTKLTRAGKLIGQYVYPVDPIQAKPTGGKNRADNGVSEILAIDDDTLLVIERSGYEVGDSQFRFANRIYEAKRASATNVATVDSLSDARYLPMTKRLLVDLKDLGTDCLDNVEAAAWGPRLENGSATLILVADDNFTAHQKNRFLLFEIIER
jgi:hypothetical protein